MRTLTAALRRAASGPGQFRPDTSQGERPGRRVKRFTPDAGATWLLTDIVTTENGSESPSSMDRRPLVISDPEDPDRAFRLCDLGFVRLQELAALRGRLRPPIERDFGFADKPISGYAREARLSGRIVAWPAPSAGSLCGWRGLPSWLCRLRFIVQSGSWAALKLTASVSGRAMRAPTPGCVWVDRSGAQWLDVLGLVQRVDTHRWRTATPIEQALGAMGERADILRAMHRALRGSARECVPVASASAGLVGRVVGKGLGDALNDRGCLVVDGLDGRAHLPDLPAGADLAALPLDASWSRGRAAPRAPSTPRS